MSKAGEVYENPVTGERAVVRAGTEETGGGHRVIEIYVAPGGAVAGEHVHQDIEETFTAVRGRVGFRLDGREDVAGPTRRLVVPPGVVHDWWNAGKEEAHVIVELRGEIRRLERFELMISTLYGLAQHSPGLAPCPRVRRRHHLQQTAPLRAAPAFRDAGASG